MRSKKGLAQGHRASQRPFFFLFFFSLWPQPVLLSPLG